MTRVEKHSSDGGPLTMSDDFKYDVFGNRIQKSYDDDGSGPHAAVVTRFAYEGGNAWGDLDSANNLQTRRLNLNALDSAFGKRGRESFFLDSGGPVWPNRRDRRGERCQRGKVSGPF